MVVGAVGGVVVGVFVGAVGCVVVDVDCDAGSVLAVVVGDDTRSSLEKCDRAEYSPKLTPIAITTGVDAAKITLSW